MKEENEYESTTHVSWLIKLGNKQVWKEEHDVSCYSSITYEAIPRNSKFIETWISVNRCPFDENEIKEWIADVNSWGFPMEYNGIIDRNFTPYDYKPNPQSHLFTIPIKNKEPKGYIVYKDRLHLNSGLTLVRYLWERGIHLICHNYLCLKRELPDVDTFELMQMAHLYAGDYMNTNHTLRDKDVRSFISREEIFGKMKDRSPFIKGRVNVTGSWNGKYLGISKKHPTKELYDNIKKQS